MALNSFNIKWKDLYPWINTVPKDEFNAYCKLCNTIFGIASKGEDSVKEHAENDIHKQKLSSETKSMDEKSELKVEHDRNDKDGGKPNLISDPKIENSVKEYDKNVVGDNEAKLTTESKSKLFSKKIFQKCSQKIFFTMFVTKFYL